MSEICPTCVPVDCCNPTPLFAYSVSSGQLFLNEQTSLSFTCPPGFSCIPGVYTIPKGRIRLRVNTNGSPSVLSLQGCISLITRTVPANSTPAAVAAIVQQLVNAAAAQLAQCTFNQTVTGRGARFRNTAQCVTICPPGKVVDTSSLPLLPRGYSVVDDQLCVAPSIYTSSSNQSDANARALLAATALRNSLVAGNSFACGYFNEEVVFICPDDSTVIVPAGDFFSEASLAAANALAEAYAPTQCPVGTCCLNVGADIATSAFPVDCAYNSQDGTLFVATQSAGIDVIDCSTNTVFFNIPTTLSPFSIGYSPVQNQMFVAASTYPNDIIYVVDASTATIIDSIALPVGVVAPGVGFCYNSNQDKLYAVTGTAHGSVIIEVDCFNRTSAVRYTHATGAGEGLSGRMAWDSSVDNYWCAMESGGTDGVAVFGPNMTLINFIASGGSTFSYAGFLFVPSATPFTGTMYYAGTANGVYGISIYDTGSFALISTINTGTVGGIALDTNCNVLFQRGVGSITQIDISTNTVLCSTAKASSYGTAIGVVSAGTFGSYATTEGVGVFPLTP